MTQEITTLNIQPKENYTIVEIDNGKVNAINTKLLEDLLQTFHQLQKDEAINGTILSGRPNAFSAGLDIMSMSSLNEAQRIHFWECYMQVMQVMVSFSKPLICAITGYAPAGATILTLCTDYRIMAQGEKHVMGMHEFKMSMQIPEMLCDVYAYHLGEVEAWKAVQEATLYNSDEALKVGLVDESLPTDEVLPRAEVVLKRRMKVYHKVYAQSKKYFHKQLHQIVMNRNVAEIAKQTVEFNSDPDLQAKVFEFMMALKRK